MPFKVGQKVSFIAVGKGARVDGIAGKRVFGVVQREQRPDFKFVSVKITSHTSLFDGTLVPAEKLSLVD